MHKQGTIQSLRSDVVRWRHADVPMNHASKWSSWFEFSGTDGVDARPGEGPGADVRHIGSANAMQGN